MAIQPIGFNSYSTKYQTNFKSREEYENPINRKSERNLAILGSVGGSLLVGGIAGGLSTLSDKIRAKKLYPVLIGTVAALISLGLTLPSKLYNTKVNAYAREKEMDVFSRQKSAQSNIYEDIDNEIKDDKVSLDDKINHYSTVKMADNGNGMMIKGV